MTTSEAINERIEALNEELSAIHQAQNISRCWAGNHTALLNLDRRETEVCRAVGVGLAAFELLRGLAWQGSAR